MHAPLYVSVNGGLVAPSQAHVSVFNPAIYGAYGVYESMQAVGGVLCELDAHLARLARSAQLIRLALPADPSTIGDWSRAVISANGASDCVLRLFVIGAEDGGASTAYIWPEPPRVYPVAYYETGATAVTFEAQRFMPEAKSLNALASFMAQRKARAAGAHEALLHHAGHLTEGSNSNLFAIVQGEVLTPPAATVLAGVTRSVTMRLAAEAEIPLREAPLSLSSLGHWEECFITSTSRHIMPVVRIDGAPVGDGGPGPVTRRLMACYAGYFAALTGGTRAP